MFQNHWRVTMQHQRINEQSVSSMNTEANGYFLSMIDQYKSVFIYPAKGATTERKKVNSRIHSKKRKEQIRARLARTAYGA